MEQQWVEITQKAVCISQMAGFVQSFGRAKRQLDTHTSAVAWNFSCKDYIMHSIFEQVPVTFVPASGKLSGVCTHKHSTYFELTFW